MSGINDKQRMDFLEKYFLATMSETYNRISLRNSNYGRGSRLHVCRSGHWKPNYKTIREAIDDALKAGDE